MRTLVRVPIAALYAVGIVTMMVCALPFIAVGFVVGFIKWSGQIGSGLADKLFMHFR